MKNNIVLTFLFTISCFFSIMCLTLFNTNFVLKKMEKFDYYEKQYISLTNYLNSNSIEYKLKKSDFKYDIEKYVKSRYSKYYIHNKIESSTNTDNIYLDYVKFNNILEKYNANLIIYISFMMTILLVIVTGNIFIRTKGKHNLDLIFIYSSITLILIYGGLYLLFSTNNEFLGFLVNESLHYLLGISVIMLDIVFIKKYIKRIS